MTEGTSVPPAAERRKTVTFAPAPEFMTEIQPLLSGRDSEASQDADDPVILYRRKPFLIIISSVIAAVFSVALVVYTISVRSDFSHTNKAISTARPPFHVVENRVLPQFLEGNTNLIRSSIPIPTNMWWNNFIVAQVDGSNAGLGEVTVSPYSVRCTNNGLQVSYGNTRRVATSESVIEQFSGDLVVGSIERIKKRRVYAMAHLSTNLKFTTHDNGLLGPGILRVHLVRGSPYITVKYHRATPRISSHSRFLTVNGHDIRNLSDSEVHLHGMRFEIALDNGQTWLLYTHRQINLLVGREVGSGEEGDLYFLQTHLYYDGILRAAVVPHCSTVEQRRRAIRVLDTYSNAYPSKGKLLTGYYEDNGQTYARVRFEYTVRGVGDLLMLAMPHHYDNFNQPSAAPRVLAALGHRCLKGNMTAVLGDTWEFNIKLMFPTWSTLEEIDGYRKEGLRAALELDKELPIDDYVPYPRHARSKSDLYDVARQLARQARIALVAEKIGSYKERDRILLPVESVLSKWLGSSNTFVYDIVWGGICTTQGTKTTRAIRDMRDGGNGWYNDHHFQYGYVLFAAAVVSRFNTEFLHEHKGAILSLVRDIANPSPLDPFFPTTRHFSWFDFHSWSSGIHQLDDGNGKWQDRIGEALHAYYSVALIGHVLSDDHISKTGRLLFTLEANAAKLYWQMRPGQDIYERVFESARLAGTVGTTRVYAHRNSSRESKWAVHLSNLIPFSPIALEVLDSGFVEEEYTLLTNSIEKRGQTSEWLPYLNVLLAKRNATEAWQKTLPLQHFEIGTSKTEVLYWIAVIGAQQGGSSGSHFLAGYRLRSPLTLASDVSTSGTQADRPAGLSAEASEVPRTSPILMLAIDP